MRHTFLVSILLPGDQPLVSPSDRTLGGSGSGATQSDIKNSLSRDLNTRP